MAHGVSHACFPKAEFLNFDSYHMSNPRAMLVLNRSTKLTRREGRTDINNTLQAENTEAQKVVTEWQRVPGLLTRDAVELTPRMCLNLKY